MLNMFNLTPQDAPLEIFKVWFEEASNQETDASAFSLATSDAQGNVSNRMLLYKGINQVKVDNVINDALTFVSNYQSKKAEQLSKNSSAAMTFYWENWKRQVRLEGRAYKLSNEISDELFLARSIDSR